MGVEIGEAVEGMGRDGIGFPLRGWKAGLLRWMLGYPLRHCRCLL